MTKLMLPEKWDHETDVLIIGDGTAGIPAGIAVIEAGFKATILELTSSCGGSGRMIGVSAAFAGTDFQKQTGIEDSPDLLVRGGIVARFHDFRETCRQKRCLRVALGIKRR